MSDDEPDDALRDFRMDTRGGMPQEALGRMAPKVTAYPWSLLRPEDSALVLFCAAFRGAQDLQHVRAAGVRRVIAVDRDGEKLNAMKSDYEPAPQGWGFAAVDGFAAVENALAAMVAHPEMRPSVLSSDPWSGTHEGRCVDMIGEFLALPSKLLIFGCSEIHKDRAMTEFAVKGYEPNVTLRAEKPRRTYWLTIVKP